MTGEEPQELFFGWCNQVVAWLSGWLSHAIDGVEWFFLTIASQVDNREIASALLVFSLVLLAVFKRKDGRIIKSLGDLISTALKLNLFVPVALLVMASVAVFFIAYRLGVWTPDILLDTIIEILFVGVPSLWIAARARSATSVCKQLVLPEIKLGAFVAFYVGIENFSIPVEFVLQFLILLLSGIELVGKRRRNAYGVVKVAESMLVLLGLGILGAETYQIIDTWGSRDWISVGQTLLMSIYYPIMILPFAIMLGYYAAYETLAIRIKMRGDGLGRFQRYLLFILLLPSLRDIKHFGNYEALEYAKRSTWRERYGFIKSYKERIRETASKNIAKQKRMKAGLGKAGFDEEGIWLDWTDLESIKSALWTLASVQNNSWSDNHHYLSNQRIDSLKVFVPPGCTAGHFVSSDCSVYAYWISSESGFTFGMGAASGQFPPLKYEGPCAPEVTVDDPLKNFVDSNDSSRLPNWFMDFRIDDTYVK